MSVTIEKRNKCFDLLDRIANEQDFFSRVITDDESWVFKYDPETKRQSKERHTVSSPRPKKTQMIKSKFKSMLICLFGRRQIALFPKLINVLKERHFGTLENIQKSVTDMLKTIPLSLPAPPVCSCPRELF